MKNINALSTVGGIAAAYEGDILWSIFYDSTAFISDALLVYIGEQSFSSMLIDSGVDMISPEGASGKVSGTMSCHCHLTPQMITAVGGLTGLIPGVKISGINAGRGSMNAVYKQMSTKFARGQISSVSTRTALKMFAGRATDTAVLQGTAVGTLSGLYAEPLIPGYSNSSSCDCK